MAARSNLGRLALVAASGCDERVRWSQFGPLVGSGVPQVVTAKNGAAIDQNSWISWTGDSERVTMYNTNDQPSLSDDLYGSFAAGYRLEGVFSRIRIDCISFKWQPVPPQAPAPAGTSTTLEVQGPVIQFRIRLGLDLGGTDPVCDLDWAPPIYRVTQDVSDYGSLVQISGVPFNTILIYARIPQNQQGFLQQNLQGLAGFHIYVDLLGATSRLVANGGQYTTVTQMMRSYERLTNLP